MPEIAEVKLMMDAIKLICTDTTLKQIVVLGGRYKPYHIVDNNGQLINKVKNPKTGRLISIDPQKYPFGHYQTSMDELDTFNHWLATNNNQSPPIVNVNGKFGWLEFDQGWTLSFTFGMSGCIMFEPTDEILSVYSQRIGKTITREDYMKNFHVTFEMTNGSCFYFGDIRRFGTIVISHDRTKLDKKLSQLGHDMLTDTPLTSNQFIDIFRRPQFKDENICKVLMGQKAISGVGNYIKAEVLYECQINPYALVSDLDDSTLNQLNQAIQQIAKHAYESRGASLYTYVGSSREEGSFQGLLKVYGRATDLVGNPVETIHETLSPDKRTTHYVKSIQTKGAFRAPSPKVKIPIKLKV